MNAHFFICGTTAPTRATLKREDVEKNERTHALTKMRKSPYCCSKTLIPESSFYVVSGDGCLRKKIQKKAARQSWSWTTRKFSLTAFKSTILWDPERFISVQLWENFFVASKFCVVGSEFWYIWLARRNEDTFHNSAFLLFPNLAPFQSHLSCQESLQNSNVQKHWQHYFSNACLLCLVYEICSRLKVNLFTGWQHITLVF